MSENQELEQEVVFEDPIEETQEGESEQPVVEATEQQEDVPAKRETGSQREKRKRLQAERELAALRSEVESLKRGGMQAQPTAPQLADFNSVEEYLEHEFSRREAARKQRELEQEWAKREAEARSKIEDFEDAFDDFVQARPSQDIVAAVMESPVGPEMAAYLGNHPEELNRIKSLSPRRQVLELGKIEDRLTRPAEKPKQTKAPAPISPVRPAGSVASRPIPNRSELY